MRILRRFFERLRSSMTIRQDEERLRIEIEEHLALQTAANIRAGVSPAEARRQAVLKFGAVEAIRESYRDQKRLPFLETLVQDARHGWRRLRKAPAFTVTTVLTLALGIGATTSIFTLVHAVILKPLAVANPKQLYRLGKESRCCYLGGYSEAREFSLVSYDLYRYFRDHTAGFSELAAFQASQTLFGARREGDAEPAQSYTGEFVSGNYFTMFGIAASAGRALTSSDDAPGAAPAAVMSHRLWQEKYAADPSVVGGIFQLNDQPVTVVGIAPPGFFGDTLRSSPPDFFLPLNLEPLVEVDADLKKYDTHWLELIGRIKPGAAAASIEAGMRVELKQWLSSHWGEMSANDRAVFPDQTLYLVPGGAGITSMREQYEHWLQILMMVSGFVLLIVCANVAHLMLVRGLERRRQTSLSMALGARPSRVVMQALTESMLLSLLGGAAGLAVAFACTRLILRFAFPALPGFASVPIDAWPSLPVLLFASIVSLLTGVVFGIAPAWMTTRVDPIEALRGAGRASSGSGSGSVSFSRRTLVVFQAALSLVLLSTAGLLTAALQGLEKQDFGFDQEQRAVARFNPRSAGYHTDQLASLYRRIHDSIADISGVSSVALCTYAPQSGGQWGAGIWLAGHPPPGPRDDVTASWDRVTNGYFDAIGNPIVKGRALSEQDTPASRRVAVINQAFARKFFKNEDPIGKHFGFSGGGNTQFEVVGIAKDARFLTSGLDQPISAFFFLPEAQADYTQRNAGSLFLSDIVIRTKPGSGLPVAQIRQAIAFVDPNLAVISIRPLTEQVASQFTQQRLIARLTSFFGILSLVLASIGLYGVTAYNAGSRVREMGVRIALGADRVHVAALMLRGALGLILVGLATGLPLTFAAGRFLGSQLYGMSPYRPGVMALAMTSLALTAFAASMLPAIRASRASPLDALRAD